MPQPGGPRPAPLGFRSGWSLWSLLSIPHVESGILVLGIPGIAEEVAGLVPCVPSFWHLKVLCLFLCLAPLHLSFYSQSPSASPSSFILSKPALSIATDLNRPPFPLSYLLFPSPWWAAPPSLCFLVAESSPHETPSQACPSQRRSPGSGLSLLIKALLTSVPWWDSGLRT